MRRGAGVALVFACVLGAMASHADATQTKPKHRFEVTTAAHTFGQAPAFMPDGRVVVAEDDKQGHGQQIYISNLDRTGRRCLTCDPVPNQMKAGPSGVPMPRPQGDWILYHSWTDQYMTLGSPGFGGLGSVLWAMRPDGTRRTQLTGVDDSKGGGEGEDAYHAYWSPDGRYVAWSHLNWDVVLNGGEGKWDLRVADFVVGADGTPSLQNERVVPPPNGHWMEMQWWAPDQSGFLFTETYGSTMNTELFFCRLEDVEGEGQRCEVTRLTDDPAWDEQAIFTPDMESVIFMSTRDRDGIYNSFSAAAASVGAPADLDYLLVLPVFEVGFLQPVGQETTDLYQLDLKTRAVRRLTTDGDDGWIIPEFTWDPKNKYLFWTELRFHEGVRAQFPIDPERDAAELAAYLQHPDPPDTGNPNALQHLPIERRTRIGRFKG